MEESRDVLRRPSLGWTPLVRVCVCGAVSRENVMREIVLELAPLGKNCVLVLPQKSFVTINRHKVSNLITASLQLLRPQLFPDSLAMRIGQALQPVHDGRVRAVLTKCSQRKSDCLSGTRTVRFDLGAWMQRCSTARRQHFRHVHVPQSRMNAFDPPNH